jgi:uncharacterized protein (DUF1330 family)
VTAYFIAIRSEIIDHEAMQTYRSMAAEARIGHAMTPLAAYGRTRTTEGSEVDGAVILAFPSFAEAEAWYESEAYQAAMKHRLRGGKYATFIVEGLD